MFNLYKPTKSTPKYLIDLEENAETIHLKIVDENGEDIESGKFLTIDKKTLMIHREKYFNDALGVPLDDQLRIKEY